MSIHSKASVIRLGLIILLGSGITVTSAAADNQSADNGWYTAEQAKEGHLLYNTYCAQCHRPELTGALGPALVGKPFLDKWSQHTLSDLYQFEHKNMPANNPGTVPEDKLDDITAYILSKNGFAAGTQALAPGQGMDRTLTP